MELDCEFTFSNARLFTNKRQFIIEGILTVLVAIGGYIFLVPFPDDDPHKCWGFLNQREVAWVIARVDADRGDAQTEPFSLAKFLKPAGDAKVSARLVLRLMI